MTRTEARRHIRQEPQVISFEQAQEEIAEFYGDRAARHLVDDLLNGAEEVWHPATGAIYTLDGDGWAIRKKK